MEVAVKSAQTLTGAISVHVEMDLCSTVMAIPAVISMNVLPTLMCALRHALIYLEDINVDVDKATHWILMELHVQILMNAV
jgi:hypothetical protein